MLNNLSKVFYGVLLAAFLAACGASSPENKAVNFMRAMYAGDSDKVLSLVAGLDEKSNEEEKNAAKGKINMIVAMGAQAAKERGGVKSVRVNPEVKTTISDKGDAAEVSVLVKFGDDSTKVERVRLVKEKGQWKVRI